MAGNLKMLIILIAWIVTWGFLTQFVLEPIGEGITESQRLNLTGQTNQRNTDIINGTNTLGTEGPGSITTSTAGNLSRADLTEGGSLQTIKGVTRLLSGFSIDASQSVPGWLLFLIAGVNMITAVAAVWIIVALIRGTT